MPTPKIGRSINDIVTDIRDLDKGMRDLAKATTKNPGDRLMVLIDALQKAPDPRMVGGPPAYWTWWDEVRKVALDTAGRLSASEGCLALMIWCAVMGWVL